MSTASDIIMARARAFEQIFEPVRDAMMRQLLDGFLMWYTYDEEFGRVNKDAEVDRDLLSFFMPITIVIDPYG